MIEFSYQELLPLGEDATPYRLLTNKFVSTGLFEGAEILKIEPEGLRLLAEEAFKDVSHLLRPGHLKQLAAILDDAESSDNDRYVALEMLENAVISAEGVFPMCQDTGTAIVMGKKGQHVWTDGPDEAALSEGIFDAYTGTHLRYSQNAPLSMYDEKNTGCNLPAQIEIYATQEMPINFSLSPKVAGLPTSRICIRKPKPSSTRKLFSSF